MEYTGTRMASIGVPAWPFCSASSFPCVSVPSLDALSIHAEFVLPAAGFICSVNETPIAVGWTRLYQMCYFVNIAIAISVYCLLSLLFPPEGLGIAEPWDSALLGGSSQHEVGDPVASEDKEHAVEVEVLSAAPHIA